MDLTASCHCGATRASFPAPSSAKTCNCTYCARAGALWAYFDPDQITVEAADDRTYAPNGLNQHHFCGTCGMQTHGYSPDWASIYNIDGTPKDGFEAGAMPTKQTAAVNLRMVPDLDTSAIAVTEVDGRNSW